MNRTVNPAPAAPWMQDTLRQGFNALQSGRIEQSDECCNRVLGAKPDLPEGHFLVGPIAPGKELEDLGKWDEAFDAFARGAPARRTTSDFDEAGEQKMYDALRWIRTNTWSKSRSPGCDGKLGTGPRAGTHTLDRALASP